MKITHIHYYFRGHCKRGVPKSLTGSKSAPAKQPLLNSIKVKSILSEKTNLFFDLTSKSYHLKRSEQVFVVNMKFSFGKVAWGIY